MPPTRMTLADAIISTGATQTKMGARQLVAIGAVSIDGVKATLDDLSAGEDAILGKSIQVGRRHNVKLVRLAALGEYRPKH